MTKYPRAPTAQWSICGLAALCTLLVAAPALAREVLPRNPREGVFDASLVVLVRQVKPDEFRIEEVFLGDKAAGTTLRLPKFHLYTQQEDGPDEVEAITPATRILLFLQPKAAAALQNEIPTYGDWQITEYGNCFFWVHDPAKMADLRKMAQDAVALRKAWEKARDISDPRRRAEALLPFLSEVTAPTERELKRAAPISCDVLAERFDGLSSRDRLQVLLRAGSYGGKKLHDKVRDYMQKLQQSYERFLKDRGPGAEKLIEGWDRAPSELKEIYGESYYGLNSLVEFKDCNDLPFIRETAAWATKYRFRQTCEAALIGFRYMPEKKNLPLIDAIGKAFLPPPDKANEAFAYDVSRTLCAHRYPETVPILAPFLAYEFGRRQVQDGLREIVGKDLGDQPQAWLDWYKRRSNP